MYVYLVLDGICKKTARVFLDLEKCVPCVGTYTESTVDPPLWYKALVMDSILFDCDHKTVYWSLEPCDVSGGVMTADETIYTEKVRAFFKTKEQMFNEKICAELDPSQVEMFETAEDVYNSLSPEVFDRDGNVPTYKGLLKIVHVYILPNIKLQQKHEIHVHDALKTIEKEYENIEMLIKMKVQLKKNSEESLKRKRHSLLKDDGFWNTPNSKLKDNEIVHLLLKHWEKDIRQLENTLSMMADQITPLRNATDETSKQLLADKRSERDNVNTTKERILRAREEIINALKYNPRRLHEKSDKGKRSKPVKHECFSEMFEEYKRESVEIEDLSLDVKQHINIKIRLSSVRNATSLTLTEIHSDKSSYGYNRKKGSLEVESDLFDATKKPEDWMTLNEHVKAYLNTDQSNLKTKHLEFCTRFKENCKALQEKAKRDFFVNFGTLEPGRQTLQFGNRFSDQKEQMRFSTRWLFGSVTEKDCQNLCQQISNHILTMSDQIALEIQGNSDILNTFHSKIYICYEELVSEDLMPVICKLLEQSYTAQCEKLCAWIDKYSDLELDSINATLKSLFPVNANRERNGNQGEVKRQNVKRSASFMESLVRTPMKFSATIGRHLNTSFRRERGACSDPIPESTSVELSKRLKSTFEDFYAKLKEEDEAVSIFSKLRNLTRAVQSAQGTFSELRHQNGQGSEMCADDILDILILLICRLDRNSLLKLYAHVNLIYHLSPYFLQGSINEYSIVTLTGAFQHLFERQEMHVGLDSNSIKSR